MSSNAWAMERGRSVEYQRMTENHILGSVRNKYDRFLVLQSLHPSNPFIGYIASSSLGAILTYMTMTIVCRWLYSGSEKTRV